MSQIYIEKRIVPKETIPDRLFACFADFTPEAGAALKKIYETEECLSDDIVDLHSQHLLYNYELGEKGIIWEAGPSADSTRILNVYATPDMDSAKQIMLDDPFYKAVMFINDWWMEWSVHTPYWKIGETMRCIIEGLAQGNGAQPSCPPGAEHKISVIEVENVTPLKLIVSLVKANASRIKEIEENDKAGRPIPSFLVQHAFNRLGPGGTTAMGYDWESGPSGDSLYDLTVFSVGSMEMARLLRENDPFTQNGLFYDPEYFEWFIHMPFRKVSPDRRQVLKKLLENAGVSL
ncbi:hypothetical protein ACFL1N_04180 [Thermodesulfobacteriota bacterium]